ncbi:hypothetical protein Zmor_025772 [Zophobas morio]|uniref:Uncharacterized protein n=1 Tax=Zophobas morio TaxID=2755281 RepID=A0AA38HXP2_9CUCU|nr:hypothetical protein Zmor_025772 [Zophobas morio]
MINLPKFDNDYADTKISPVTAPVDILLGLRFSTGKVLLKKDQPTNLLKSGKKHFYGTTCRLVEGRFRVPFRQNPPQMGNMENTAFSR